MRKLTIVIVIVVLLLSALVGPVLAAVVWQWSAGESCDSFSAPEGEVSCDSNGILMSATLGYVYFVSGVDALSIDIDTDCTEFYIYDDYDNEYVYEGLPINMQTLSGDRIELVSDDPEEECYISFIAFDDEPTAGQSAFSINFSTSQIFSIASGLVAALGVLIAIIAGIYLGFRVLGYLRRLW